MNDIYMYVMFKHASKYCFIPGYLLLTTNNAPVKILVGQKTIQMTALLPPNNLDSPIPQTQLTKITGAMDVTLQH